MDEEDLAAKLDPHQPAPQPEKKTLSPTGRLNDAKYDKLLKLLLATSRSGSLKLGEKDKEIILVIDKGNLVRVHSGYIEGLALSDILLENHLVTPDYLPAVRQRMLEEKRLLGQLLIQIGLIDTDILKKALTIQMLKKAGLPFTWEDAPYEYSREYDQQLPDVSINIYLGKVLLEGLRNSLKPELVEEEYKRQASLVFKFQQSPQIDTVKLELTADEKRVLQAMDGSATIAEISAVSRLSADDVVRLVMALSVMKMVKKIGGD
jgi:hypothetical protein